MKKIFLIWVGVMVFILLLYPVIRDWGNIALIYIMIGAICILAAGAMYRSFFFSERNDISYWIKQKEHKQDKKRAYIILLLGFCSIVIGAIFIAIFNIQ